MSKLLKIYQISLLASLGLPFIAGAQTQVDTLLTNISGTLSTIIGILFVIATIVFLWGVIQFIAKSGDEEGRKKAKGIMTWGIIGLAVMAAAWGIVNILVQYFGTTGQPGFVPPPSWGRR